MQLLTVNAVNFRRIDSIQVQPSFKLSFLLVCTWETASDEFSNFIFTSHMRGLDWVWASGFVLAKPWSLVAKDGIQNMGRWKTLSIYLSPSLSFWYLGMYIYVNMCTNTDELGSDKLTTTVILIVYEAMKYILL